MKRKYIGWASNYDNQYAHGLKTEREKNISGELPLMHKVKPDMIMDMLAGAGLKNVSCVSMKEVVEAEFDAMPLRYRLAYRHERYTVTGVKKR